MELDCLRGFGFHEESVQGIAPCLSHRVSPRRDLGLATDAHAVMAIVQARLAERDLADLAPPYCRGHHADLTLVRCGAVLSLSPVWTCKLMSSLANCVKGADVTPSAVCPALAFPEFAATCDASISLCVGDATRLARLREVALRRCDLLLLVVELEESRRTPPYRAS